MEIEKLEKVGDRLFKTKTPVYSEYVKERFELSKDVKDSFKCLDSRFAFGFSGFGEYIFYSRYSRIKKDGTQEDWADCVIRVIEGLFSIRKDWYIKNNIEWNEKHWQDYAVGLAEQMYQMFWLPPGRGLWAMGSDFIYKRGSAALFNCSACRIGDDIPNAMHWIMDMLMNGVGVGLEPVRDDLMLFTPNPKEVATIIIGDSREEWCDAIKILLESYCSRYSPTIKFDYSKIRKQGLPIKGFGGVSSGPEPLVKLHEKIRLFSERFIYEKGYDSVMYKTDIANCIGCCVVAGNVRRSAELVLGSITDDTFLNLKEYDNPRFVYRREHGWMSNNAAKFEKSEDFDKINEIVERVKKSGDPSFVNLLNFRYGRIGKEDGLKEDLGSLLNPCLTGDTLVAVADGREFVSFEQLVKEENDVPVYCRNKENNVLIRMMRNPRRTGIKVPVYKIILDDGSILRATENHRFKIRNGKWRKVKRLQHGDSLEIMTKFEATMKEVLGSGSNSEYIWVNNGQRKNIAEHRLIAEFIYGDIIGKVIHHKDLNSKNNNPSNLEPCDKKDHDLLHKEKMMGFNNPMCQKYSDEWIKNYHEKMSKAIGGLKNGKAYKTSNAEILEWALELTEKLGRKFIVNEWVEFAKNNNLPQTIQRFRKIKLISVEQLAKRCEKILGYNIKKPRVFTCINCGKIFNSFTKKRKFCNRQCASIFLNLGESIHQSLTYGHEELRKKQVEIYLALKEKIGIVNKEDWKEECKIEGISCEISRVSSPFRKWKNLEEAALLTNHKVVSVELDSYQDVYNGTVDEFHNYYVGGFQSFTRSGKKKWVSINVKNCGEIVLEDCECCNLSSTFPTKCKTIEEWYKACEYATFYSSTVALLPTHRPETNKVLLKNRRIGVGIVDFTGWRYEKGLTNVIKWMRQGYKIVREINRKLAEEAGIPESIRVTTIAPGGTIPKLAGKTSGIGYPTFHYTLRRVRMQKNSPLYTFLCQQNIPHQPDIDSNNTEIFEYPIIQGPARPIGEVTIWEQAMNVITVQREWSDNAVSNTIYFRPKWSLRNIVECKTINDYENILESYLIEYGFGYGEIKDYFCSMKLEQEDVRIETIFTDDKMEIMIYVYDSNHEEDQIESVLACIAPLVKAVSLCPHSPKGIYKQMPEEEITKEEYEERLKSIGTIDWSKFKGSDGLDEKFCNSDKCDVSEYLKR